jgi:DNA-binding NtrC family response regulator
LLIIDDEPKLLRTYSILLGREFEVVVVDDGAKALALLAEDSAFDVIVCDLHMPGVDGIDIYQHLTIHAPEVAARVLFSTGSVFQARVMEFLSRNRVTLLEKPVHLEALVETITRMLLIPPISAASSSR